MAQHCVHSRPGLLKGSCSRVRQTICIMHLQNKLYIFKCNFPGLTFFLIPSEKASSSLWAMQWIPSTYGLSAHSFVTTPLFTPVITDAPSVVRATSLFFQSVLTSLSIILHTASAIFVASGFETAFTPTKSALTFRHWHS